MGLSLSSFLARVFSKKQVKLLMVGLDNAGKTTILYRLKLGEYITTVPTIGFNVESVEYKNLQFLVWDIGGQGKIRQLWRHYYKDTQALIFVIDSNDKERVNEAGQELRNMMLEEDLKSAVLLIFANKQDLPNAMSTTEIGEVLGLKKCSCKWYIQATCATKGSGICEGFDWLSNELTRK